MNWTSPSPLGDLNYIKGGKDIFWKVGKSPKGGSIKWSVPCYAHSNWVSLFQTQWPCILWFSVFNNALNRISFDTLWFIAVCLPTHTDEFSSQGCAVLTQGKPPSTFRQVCKPHHVMGSSGGLNSLVMSSEADSSTCCGYLAASTDKLLRGWSSQVLWTSLGPKCSLRWENYSLICTATDGNVVARLCSRNG